MFASGDRWTFNLSQLVAYLFTTVAIACIFIVIAGLQQNFVMDLYLKHVHYSVTFCALLVVSFVH